MEHAAGAKTVLRGLVAGASSTQLVCDGDADVPVLDFAVVAVVAQTGMRRTILNPGVSVGR